MRLSVSESIQLGKQVGGKQVFVVFLLCPSLVFTFELTFGALPSPHGFPSVPTCSRTS